MCTVRSTCVEKGWTCCKQLRQRRTVLRGNEHMSCEKEHSVIGARECCVPYHTT